MPGAQGSRGSILQQSLSQLDEQLPAFSYPQPPYVDDLDAIVPMIAREYAAGLTGAYLARNLESIERSSDGLAGYLGDWVADPVRIATGAHPTQPLLGWDYAFGDAYRTLVTADADHARVSAAIAAHVGAAGVPGSWSVRHDDPFKMRWDSWLLPAATCLEVESDGVTAAIDYSGSNGSGTASFVLSDGRWVGEGAVELRRVEGHGVAFTILARDALAMRDYEDLLERVAPSVDPRMFAVLDDALDIIADYVPQYLPWVSRTLHQLFLLTPRIGTVESGSVEHYLGLVHLTAHPESLPVAELLVHEATHQYMNVASKLEPLDDGSDQRLYWSPPVETSRPLSKIVAAFHAFANVLLFYRWCREAGLANRRECDRQEALLGGWMNDLAPPVTDNPALTATGDALCRPLLEKLSEV